MWEQPSRPRLNPPVAAERYSYKSLGPPIIFEL